MRIVGGALREMCIRDSLRDLYASASVAWFDAMERPGDQKSRRRASLISFAALCLLSKRMSDEKPRCV